MTADSKLLSGSYPERLQKVVGAKMLVYPWTLTVGEVQSRLDLREIGH